MDDFTVFMAEHPELSAPDTYAGAVALLSGAMREFTAVLLRALRKAA